MPPRTENIQGVQILRGLAALMVALAHAQNGDASRSSTNFFAWEHMLEAGVDLFFIISGFIMMLVTDPSSGRAAGPGRFLSRRIQRIVPLYWFYTLLLTVGAIAVPSLLRWTTLTPDLVIRSLFFIPSFHPVNGNIQPLLSVGWTLQYEMFFYLCFILVIGLGLGARVISMALLFGALVLLSGAIGRETAPMAFLGNRIVFEFVAGMGLYWVYRKGLVVGWAAALVGLVLLPALLWAIGSGAALPLIESIDRPWWRSIAWGLPSLLLAYAMLAVPEMSNPVARSFAYLGDASYSLYLSHVFVIAAVAKVWRSLGYETDPLFGILVALPCCIAAAVLSYRLIERPLITLARRIFAAMASLRSLILSARSS
jgi:peptidoglycan/LPS O-acetylase OafA/YrhL